MDLTFERGDAARPAGHAVLYFTTGAPERVLATYLVVLPIALNIAKYMPPMFAASLSASNTEAAKPMPLPPVPEEVPGRAYLQRMAELRGDDLVYGGTVFDDDPQRLLLETSYAAETYGQKYESYAGTALTLPAEDAAPEISTASMVYSVMSESQRLGELTKLTGALREATERGDTRGAAENTQEMRALLETLPAKYRGAHLLAAARESGSRGRGLCELLLERAYALQHEEYLDVGRIDRAIEALEKTSPQ